jgi:hypothetical protein
MPRKRATEEELRTFWLDQLQPAESVDVLRRLVMAAGPEIWAEARGAYAATIRAAAEARAADQATPPVYWP